MVVVITGVLEDGSPADVGLLPRNLPIRVANRTDVVVKLTITNPARVPLDVDGITSATLVIRQRDTNATPLLRVTGTMVPGGNYITFAITNAQLRATRFPPGIYMYDVSIGRTVDAVAVIDQVCTPAQFIVSPMLNT